MTTSKGLSACSVLSRPVQMTLSLLLPGGFQSGMPPGHIEFVLFATKQIDTDVACAFSVSFRGNGFRGLHKISCCIWHCVR